MPGEQTGETSKSAGPGAPRGGSARLPHGRHLPAHAASLKRHNLALVLAEIARGDRPSRAQVATRTGLTKATVSGLVDVLVAAGLVAEGDPGRGAGSGAGVVGRPGSPLGLDPSGPAGLGVEINVDYAAAGVVDLTGEVRARRVVTGDNRGRSATAVLHRVARLTERVLLDAERNGLAVAGIGIAVPGVVDRDGVLRRAPNLPGWEDLAVAEELAGRLPRQVDVVVCDNEANLAALAELWFAGWARQEDFVHVSGEIGVGAGIVVHGELWRGVHGLGGELGHVMVDPRGPLCSCGARGCLEQIAGQEALLRAAGAPGDGAGSGIPIATALGSPDGATRELVRRANAGDRRTLAALDRAGTALGRALAALVNLLDVPTVVLGGLYAELAPWFTGPVTTELRERVVGYTWSPVEVLVSPLGSEAAMRGAAGAVVRRILADPGLLALGAG